MTIGTSRTTNGTVESQYDDYATSIQNDLDGPVRRTDGYMLEDHEETPYLDPFSGVRVTNAGHTTNVVINAAPPQLEEVVGGSNE